MHDFAIEAAGLRVRYPGSAVDAVAGVDLAVASGEIFGLLGPNGAGKTTTQHVLTGQLRRYDGHAAVLGQPMDAWKPAFYQRIGIGFELPAHFPKLTTWENLAAFAALYDPPALPVRDALVAVGLVDVADRRAADLSKGMKMRLNLARALLHQPDVLFLDEPTSGLDPSHAADVRAIVAAQAAAGRTVFLTTHDMEAADNLCDRVAFMYEGRFVAVDTPRALKRAHGDGVIVAEYRADHGDDGGLARHEYASTCDPALRDLLAAGVVETLHTREASLADVFVAVTGQAL